MYADLIVEKFAQKPPPYAATYATPTDLTPPPDDDDDVISGEKVAKLLAKVCVHVEVGVSKCDDLSCLQGPYVYELFSIMVHSGSAIGGHYYAYIK